MRDNEIKFKITIWDGINLIFFAYFLTLAIGKNNIELYIISISCFVSILSVKIIGFITSFLSLLVSISMNFFDRFTSVVQIDFTNSLGITLLISSLIALFIMSIVDQQDFTTARYIAALLSSIFIYISCTQFTHSGVEQLELFVIISYFNNIVVTISSFSILTIKNNSFIIK